MLVFLRVFYLRFNFDFYVSKIMHLLARNLPRKQTIKCLRNQGRTKGEGWSTANSLKPPSPPPPSNFIAGRPKSALLFWFFGEFRCGTLLFMASLVITI